MASLTQMTDRKILNRIKNARNEGDIAALLAEGAMFETVSERTRSRWRIAAEKRRKWLQEQNLE